MVESCNFNEWSSSAGDGWYRKPINFTAYRYFPSFGSSLHKVNLYELYTNNFSICESEYDNVLVDADQILLMEKIEDTRKYQLYVDAAMPRDTS